MKNKSGKEAGAGTHREKCRAAENGGQCRI